MQRSPRTRASAGPSQGGPAPVRALPVQHSDEDIVAGLRASEPWARAALFDRYGRDVERVLAWTIGVDLELPDLLHDAFLRAYEHAGELRDEGRLRPWLVSIAVFTARACIRKRRRRALLRALIPWQGPDFHDGCLLPEANEVIGATRRLIERLNTDDRLVFTLRFIGQLELAEIAEACDVSLGTVKRRLNHARARFELLAASDPVVQGWRKGVVQ